MLPTNELATIKRLLHTGHKQVEVARMTGHSADLIGEIDRGEYESPFDINSRVWCQTCGHWVHPPCLACSLRGKPKKRAPKQSDPLLRLRLKDEDEQRRRAILKTSRDGCPHCGSSAIVVLDRRKSKVPRWYCQSCRKNFHQEGLTSPATVSYTGAVENEGAVQEARQPLGETG